MVRFIGKPRFTGGPIGRGGGVGAVTSRVRVVGVPKALAKLKGVQSVVRLDLGLMTKGAAEHMENLAIQYAPERTGNLKSGIHSEKVASYSYIVVASSRDGEVPEKNTYEYAPFVEYGFHAGGRFIPGQFFMTRAYNDTKPLVAIELQALARKLERL